MYRVLISQGNQHFIAEALGTPIVILLLRTGK